MTAMPPNFPPLDSAPAGGASLRDHAGEKWLTLLDAGAAIAALAGIEPAPANEAIRTFPEALRETGGWRRRMAENGIDDLAAIIEPGIAALLAVRARGTDARPAALALWHEFETARDTILALADPAAPSGG